VAGTFALADRLDVAVDSDLRPRLFAGAALAVIDSVSGVWKAKGVRAVFDEPLEDAFDALPVADLAPLRSGS